MNRDRRQGPVLVGMRGAGKTTLAPLVADRLGFVAVDADAVLEGRVGISIADMLRREGEASFRRLERDLLLDELLVQEATVLATGGGAVVDGDVRRALAARFTVWLYASWQVLWDRTRSNERPPLTSLPAAEELRAILEGRLPLYREVARLTIDTTGETPERTADTIAEAFRGGSAQRETESLNR